MIELTFGAFATQNRYCALQDPVDKGMVPFEQFVSIYGTLLEQLDGSDMMGYVTFFYQQSPVNRQNWEFVDDDAQQDFQEWAIELGCIPPLKTLQRGDDYSMDALSASISVGADSVDTVKKEHCKDTQTKQQQRQRQQANRKKAPPPQKVMRQNLLQSQTKIEQQLKKCCDPAKKDQLREKLNRVRSKLAQM